MSLKKLIVCHFVLTAAPPDSIWLAGAAIHRLGLLGESAATMRKNNPRSRLPTAGILRYGLYSLPYLAARY